ncbi:porin [Ramlibacter alkalitolerans]|uniref:Porin n=1 Tax=Ramlibacter alkalitolerans TaxID=2039631 RepID=A0ABS1JIP9_9BURK|nr:porin [Ramlibacter alkalitolerans]MBL0424105.1 porin [Ramlibacter alkalitolerans]
MKTPIALAAATLAAACGPALAQSSVTLYGTIDLGILSINHVSASRLGYVPSGADGGRATQMKDGGIGASNWGLRGREDLGGGLAATFQLQGNINAKDGTTGGPNSAAGTSFFNQFSTVGLAGAWGEVKVGRQVSPMYYAMASTDARGARYFGSMLTGLVALNSASGVFAGNNSNPAFGTIYNDNAIVYNAPAWNGLSLSAEYAFGDTAGSAKANSQQALAAIYANGGLRLSALWYNGYGNNLGTATALFTAASGSAAAGAAAAAAAGFSPTANTNRLQSVGALYTLGAWTVSGAYMQARNPAHAVVPNGSDRLDLWSVGAGWRPTPLLNVTAGYYRVKDKRNVGNHASQLAVGAEYALSKRTLLYAEGAVVRNAGANMNFSPVYATPVPADTNVHAVMAGIRHTF